MHRSPWIRSLFSFLNLFILPSLVSLTNSFKSPVCVQPSRSSDPIGKHGEMILLPQGYRRGEKWTLAVDSHHRRALTSPGEWGALEGQECSAGA